MSNKLFQSEIDRALLELLDYECKKYQYFNKLFRRTKMIKLSNGVEISEDTVVAALKAAGINIEPVKPEHIFEVGDVANTPDGGWRFIVLIDSKLIAVNQNGIVQGSGSNGGQNHFEAFNYKFVGKQSDLL